MYIRKFRYLSFRLLRCRRPLLERRSTLNNDLTRMVDRQQQQQQQNHRREAPKVGDVRGEGLGAGGDGLIRRHHAGGGWGLTAAARSRWGSGEKKKLRDAGSGKLLFFLPINYNGVTKINPLCFEARI